MTDAKTADAVYAQIGKLREMAKSKNVDIPEGAMKKVMAKFGRNKRSLPAESNQSNKKTKRAGENGEESDPASAGYAYTAVSMEDVGEEEPMAPHKTIRLVEEVREKKAANPANQKIVDAFAAYGEEQLEHGHTGKGVSHLRAALHIRDHPDAINSSKEARAVPMVGNKIAAQIEEILATGSHLYSGHRGKGISHLRAAQGIRDSDTVVKSGKQASKAIGMVGQRIAAKIDQIIQQGHADSDEDYEYDAAEEEEEEESEYGKRERDSVVPPIVRDVVSKPAEVEKNQVLVDALVEYGEEELYKRHTGRGTAFLRAARRLRDADMAVTNGQEAKKLGRIGDKVANYIDTMLAK
ncbi:hypothetical protein AM588_10005108 [Phytophthora nicotianae]|uniref:Crossover junction endonuclease MUS81-like HHH domain-containing protein n=1 Tax=Phytophthora nicotianae TaxID=4792 RepID=A0A0W8D180_PHYNI|nr:hypothetical protein AM588_10005108 [Phytophthora nicotianae]